MTNKQRSLVMFVVLTVLLWLFFLSYRKLEAGKSQIGLHIQVIGMLLAGLGGFAALAPNHVEISARLVGLAFIAGLCGHFIHTWKRRDR